MDAKPDQIDPAELAAKVEAFKLRSFKLRMAMSYYNDAFGELVGCFHEGITPAIGGAFVNLQTEHVKTMAQLIGPFKSRIDAEIARLGNLVWAHSKERE